MIVAQLRRLRVKNLFNFFRQRVNRATRGESHIDLVCFFLGYRADLQRLAFILPAGDFDGLADFDFLIFFLLLIEQRD